MCIPKPNTCCGLPLRPVILVWGYLHLILTILHVLTYIGQYLFFTLCHELSVIMLDVILTIVLLVSAHRRNHVYMRSYYISAMGLVIVGVVLRLSFVEFYVYSEYIWYLAVATVLQSCFLVLVRSETINLENAQKLKLDMQTRDPECKEGIVPTGPISTENNKYTSTTNPC